MKCKQLGSANPLRVSSECGEGSSVTLASVGFLGSRSGLSSSALVMPFAHQASYKKTKLSAG